MYCFVTVSLISTFFISFPMFISYYFEKSSIVLAKNRYYVLILMIFFASLKSPVKSGIAVL